MQLDNLYLKELIKTYINDPKNTYIRLFQENVYQYIIWWTEVRYSCNDDICQDFLVYIIEFTEQIIRSFPLDSNVLFVTWFNAVLNNKFSDFVKQGIVSKQDSFLEFYEDLSFTDLNSVADDSGSTMLGIVNKLTTAEAGLFFFYIDPNQVYGEHLKAIALLVKKTLQDVFSVYQTVLKEHCVISQQKENCKRRIKFIDHKILHYQNIIDKRKIESDKIKLLSDKIKRLENRRYKQVRFSERINYSYLDIFIGLFLDYNTAYRTSKKLQRKIKQLIMENQ